VTESTQTAPAIPLRNAVDGALARREGWWNQHEVPTRLVYWGIHAACGLALVTGVSAGDLALLVATYTLRMFF
jgi:hypothetical protein